MYNVFPPLPNPNPRCKKSCSNFVDTLGAQLPSCSVAQLLIIFLMLMYASGDACPAGDVFAYAFSLAIIALSISGGTSCSSVIHLKMSTVSSLRIASYSTSSASVKVGTYCEGRGGGEV